MSLMRIACHAWRHRPQQEHGFITTGDRCNCYNSLHHAATFSGYRKFRSGDNWRSNEPRTAEQHKIMIEVKANPRAYMLVSEHHALKVYRQCTSKVSRIINLGITWRRVVSFMLGPTLSPGKQMPVPVNIGKNFVLYTTHERTNITEIELTLLLLPILRTYWYDESKNIL
jgi:hypothetical protein